MRRACEWVGSVAVLPRLAGPGKAVRRARVNSTWDSSVSGTKGAEVEENLQFLAAHPEVSTFDDATVAVTAWNRVSVSGSDAEAVVTGTSSRHEAAGWIDEGLHQWQLKLRQ